MTMIITIIMIMKMMTLMSNKGYLENLLRDPIAVLVGTRFLAYSSDLS